MGESMKSGWCLRSVRNRSLTLSLLIFLCLDVAVPGSPPARAKGRGEANKLGFHEDWSTPALDRSTLRMIPPKFVAQEDLPEKSFIREHYEVTWRPKDPFDLYVIRPRGVAKPRAILYLYSFPDDTELFKDDHWCESVTSGGYAAVGFVSAVTGHRIRFRLLKEWFVSEMQEALATTTHDVQLVIDYLETRKDLDTAQVGMFGLGSGGSIAVLASAADPRIAVLDVVGPWADWPDWFAKTKIVRDDERAKFLSPEFLAKVHPLDPVLWLPKVQAKRVLLQDVRQNVSMPDEAQEKLEAAAPDFVSVEQYGNGKAFLTGQPPALLFDWIKAELKAPRLTRQPLEAASRIHFHPAVRPTGASWPNVGKLEISKTPAQGSETQAKQKP
jgi:hypothetical protein